MTSPEAPRPGPESDPVAVQARQRPLAPAVVGREAWTWQAWDRRVGQAAAGLRALGAPRIAVRAGDRLTLAALALGAARAGVTAVLVPVRWPASLAHESLRRAGVTAVVSDLPGLDGTEPEAAFAAKPLAAAPDPDALALAVFTSGSTGAPKAAALSWGALLASAGGVGAHLGLGAGDRWLLDLPVAHVGGLGIVVRCALAGAAMAVPEPRQPLAEAVRSLRPTHASLVSTQLRRLLASPGDRSSLRAVLLGGSAIPPDLLSDARASGLPVAPSYGLTEMGSTVTAADPGAAPEAGSSGRPLAGREVRVRGGEIEVRGATRFAGYLRESGLAEPFDAEGWFATGDLGRTDARGRLFVEGRRGLRFVSGGENVQPEAIERALLALPAVREAVVVPIPVAEYGHRPLAWVRPAAGAVADADAFGAALRESLPGFMVPVRFLPWDGAGGMKPDRQRLQREAEAWASDSA